jgi:mono/diheme cytochrome c family protein
MKKAQIYRILQIAGLVCLALATMLVIGLVTRERPVHALPEFSERTGEACGACHVNPGGGGPRTMRGLLWAAQGRPDEVPTLGNILLAPGVSDGGELYDIACASCHGLAGEGLFGTALTGTGLSESKVKSSIERGRERSGMPAYEGQFTDEQMDVLVDYVAGIASGRIEPPPLSYPLPEGELNCNPNPAVDNCQGN